MTVIEKSERAARIREMFGRISGRYDLVNHLIALGLDRSWRRYAVGKAAPPKGGRLLDVGSGTGDIAFEALRLDSSLEIAAVDFSLQMMAVGRRRPAGREILWCNADALQLPFPDAVFDAVLSGYLIRNVTDIRQAFEEQMRVVKPGGRIVCLDTSPVQRSLLWPFIMFHMNVIIPLLGYMFTRDRDAYRYLPKSTEAFVRPEELASIMKSAGIVSVSYRKFLFGIMAVHTGLRPDV